MATTARDISILFAGNVVTQPFGALKARLAGTFTVQIEHFGIDQIFQCLAEDQDADILILHYDHRLFFDLVPGDEALARAEEFCTAVADYTARTKRNVILNTVPYVPLRFAETAYLEQRETLAAINMRLGRLARENAFVSVFDLEMLLARAGFDHALRERNRHVMQFPYSGEAKDAIVGAYADLVRLHYSPRKKVLVLDADNTLWRGVVGEDGVDGIGIDREYPGVIHLLFQKQALHLKDLGIVLCVVTKNNEADFREAFEKRDMPLSLDDFVMIKSNWEPKSQNIRQIAEDLNLGLDSFVFADDSPFELEEVANGAPGVECVRFPADNPEQALTLLDNILGLKSLKLTDEDRTKSAQYKTEGARASLRQAAGSTEDYIKGLEIEIHVGRNHAPHVPRIAQLTNKTNQFNLTTKRYTPAEIEDFMARGDVFDFRVIDRFGDMGIVGVAIVADGEIDTFLMSCRALGRQIESQILRYVCDAYAGTALKATYAPTKKNAMVERFFESCGFEHTGSDGEVKLYRLKEGPDVSEHIRIVEL